VESEGFWHDILGLAAAYKKKKQDILVLVSPWSSGLDFSNRASLSLPLVHRNNQKREAFSLSLSTGRRLTRNVIFTELAS